MKTRAAVLLAMLLGLLAQVAWAKEPPAHFEQVKKMSLADLGRSEAGACEITYLGEAPDMEGHGDEPGMPHYFRVKCSNLPPMCRFLLHPSKPLWAGPIDCTENPDYRPTQRM